MNKLNFDNTLKGKEITLHFILNGAILNPIQITKLSGRECRQFGICTDEINSTTYEYIQTAKQ